MIYDMLKLSKALRASFTPEQSDTLAQAFSDSTEDNVATKRDIAELKAGIAELRAEQRTEIAGLRAEQRTEIAGVKGEIAGSSRDEDRVRCGPHRDGGHQDRNGPVGSSVLSRSTYSGRSVS